MTVDHMTAHKKRWLISCDQLSEYVINCLVSVLFTHSKMTDTVIGYTFMLGHLKNQDSDSAYKIPWLFGLQFEEKICQIHFFKHIQNKTYCVNFTLNFFVSTTFLLENRRQIFWLDDHFQIFLLCIFSIDTIPYCLVSQNERVRFCLVSESIRVSRAWIYNSDILNTK